MKPKIYHRAKHVNAVGQVSALCYKRRHPIDLSRESWTLRDEDASCKKCLALIAERNAAANLDKSPPRPTKGG